jgi:hypothetical protein
MNKKSRFLLYYCLSVLLVTVALLVTARLSTGFAEWYARNIFPLFPHTLGRLFSLLPFSAGELLVAALAAGLSILFFYSLLLLAGGPAGRVKLLWHWRILGLCLAVLSCTLLLMFMLTCGVNYSRAPLAAELELESHPASVQELRLLYSVLCQEINSAAGKVTTDTEGHFILPTELQGKTRAAMRRLGGSYTLLDTYYPRPKPVFYSQGLSYLHISGIYSPFTVEANYNRHMPSVDIPFAVCHELAHVAGYVREDEANFIAFLACRESGERDLLYSGLINALTYVLGALYTELPQAEYSELYRELPTQAQQDMRFSAAYWQRFAGPVSELSRNINDYYLKANAQPEGVKSYGGMVDLLLAYYLLMCCQ